MSWKIAAIDGLAKAGKTTLAQQIARDLGNVYVVSIDDFFLPEPKRRLAVVAKQYDLERLIIQVFEPALSGMPIHYQKFNWNTGSLDELHHRIPVGSKILVEGTYSLDIKLRHAYDFSIFVHTPQSTRTARFGPSARTGMGVDITHDPEEMLYLNAEDPAGFASVVVPGDMPFPKTHDLMAILGQAKLAS